MIKKSKCSIAKVLLSLFTLTIGIGFIWFNTEISETENFPNLYFSGVLIFISIINTLYMNEVIDLNQHHIVIVHKIFWWRKKILIDSNTKLYKKYTFYKPNGKKNSYKISL